MPSSQRLSFQRGEGRLGGGGVEVDAVGGAVVDGRHRMSEVVHVAIFLEFARE